MKLQDLAMKQAAVHQQFGQIGQSGQNYMAIDHNPTVEENIDLRIKLCKEEIARLEESKKSLGPLLPMRISDIRNAMQF